MSPVGLALLAVLLSVAPAFAQLPPLPAGWERPKDSDLAGANWEFRKDKPDRYVRAEGDFNGDGKTDRAELLINRKTSEYGVFAFIAGDGAATELDRSPLKFLGGMGISVGKPGRRLTVCGKGYYANDRECKKGVPFIDLRYSTIDFFVFESATSEFYWTGSKFERFWTSD